MHSCIITMVSRANLRTFFFIFCFCMLMFFILLFFQHYFRSSFFVCDHVSISSSFTKTKKFSHHDTHHPTASGHPTTQPNTLPHTQPNHRTTPPTQPNTRRPTQHPKPPCLWRHHHARVTTRRQSVTPCLRASEYMGSSEKGRKACTHACMHACLHHHHHPRHDHHRHRHRHLHVGKDDVDVDAGGPSLLEFEQSETACLQWRSHCAAGLVLTAHIPSSSSVAQTITIPAETNSNDCGVFLN